MKIFVTGLVWSDEVGLYCFMNEGLTSYGQELNGTGQ